MTGVPRLSIPLLVFGIAALPTTARADVIQVSGQMVGDEFGVHLAIHSLSRGFSLSASGARGSGLYDLAECNSNECKPGDMLSLAAGWNGVDFGGTATIDGSTFLVGLITNTSGAASAHFAGTWTAPAFNGATTATVTAPFSLTGGLAYADAGQRLFRQIEGARLTGVISRRAPRACGASLTPSTRAALP